MNDRPLGVAGGRVLAPRHEEVRDHPVGQSPLVVVDEDNAVSPPSAVLLVIEQQACEGAAQSGASGSSEVVGTEPTSELGRDTDVEKPEIRD